MISVASERVLGGGGLQLWPGNEAGTARYLQLEKMEEGPAHTGGKEGPLRACEGEEPSRGETERPLTQGGAGDEERPQGQAQNRSGLEREGPFRNERVKEPSGA
ncbi:hypothetical protein NDU88_003185 [Pleurodeles waltl]|uniref:Uncharacterized protein n=1 Tax=Pleurodeles waltl TaxID=8319 RepID=A0AAV7MPV1_PLEWA|nr:hypothetical protein NDU88_003185 [Pleurodeles waltl]